MIARAAVCIAILAGGCTSYRSQYTRQAAAPGELVWRYDNRLQVTLNGQVIAEAGDWAGLSPAVACVPRAGAWASTARTRHRNGSVVMWGGLIAMVAGVAAGAAIALGNTDDTGQIYRGLGIMGAGALVGIVTLPAGGYLRATADTRGIDAVNLYNDQLAAGACR